MNAYFKKDPDKSFNHSTDYQQLLGEQQWLRLHPAIRRRFQNNHQMETYTGLLSIIYLSFFGSLLAHCLRIIGTPLALYNGKDVPLTVYVYPDSKGQGLVWDRHYLYAHQPVNRVRSTKIIEKKSGLIECVGAGFGMHLVAYEKDAAIVFESRRFFWQFFNYKIPLPHHLSPGKTTVTQKAINDNEFEFSLIVNHPLLGKVYEQKGIFQ